MTHNRDSAAGLGQRCRQRVSHTMCCTAAGGILIQRLRPDGRVVAAGGVEQERRIPGGRVIAAGPIASESNVASFHQLAGASKASA